MASVTSEGGGSGRKRVDQQIPLIPFIDLLLCCVMFLLVTAIWNETGEIPTQLTNAATEEGLAPGAERDSLILEVTRDGFVLASTEGDRIEVPAREGDLDFVALDQRLAERLQVQQPLPVKVRPDDDIRASTLVATMDLLRRRGYASLSFL